MRYFLTNMLILSLLILPLSSCGRRGALEKPFGEGVYPRIYPMLEEGDYASKNRPHATDLESPLRKLTNKDSLNSNSSATNVECNETPNQAVIQSTAEKQANAVTQGCAVIQSPAVTQDSSTNNSTNLSLN